MCKDLKENDEIDDLNSQKHEILGHASGNNNSNNNSNNRNNINNNRNNYTNDTKNL